MIESESGLVVSSTRRTAPQTRRLWLTAVAYSPRVLSRISGSEEIMAKQIITLLTDDLDGGEADRTIEFGLDGGNYTIDLSEKNAGKLRKALDPFLTAASKVGRTGANGRIASRAAAAPS